MAGTAPLQQGGTWNIAESFQKGGDPDHFSLIWQQLRGFFMFGWGLGGFGTVFDRGCTPAACHAKKDTPRL